MTLDQVLEVGCTFFEIGYYEGALQLYADAIIKTDDLDTQLKIARLMSPVKEVEALSYVLTDYGLNNLAQTVLESEVFSEHDLIGCYEQDAREHRGETFLGAQGATLLSPEKALYHNHRGKVKRGEYEAAARLAMVHNRPSMANIALIEGIRDEDMHPLYRAGLALMLANSNLMNDQRLKLKIDKAEIQEAYARVGWPKTI